MWEVKKWKGVTGSVTSYKEIKSIAFIYTLSVVQGTHSMSILFRTYKGLSH